MMKHVRPFISVSSAACTSLSLSVSSALVASSRIRILGSLSRARAMLSRCRWPPERFTPRSPRTVWYPSGRAEMKSWALAAFAAAITWASVASGRP